MKYSITQENALDDELQIVSEGLDRFTRSQIDLQEKTQLTFFLRDEEGKILGGVHGNYSSFGWLYISSLWVAEEMRGKGYGNQLMNCIEQCAIENGCVNAYVDTLSFQAPEFYKKLGYVIFGELEDFPIGHSRCFLRKKLSK